jgi:hypothetical protein
MATAIKDTPQKPKNICILGLSANPPTGLLGHQGIVKKLVELREFNEVCKFEYFSKGS